MTKNNVGIGGGLLGASETGNGTVFVQSGSDYVVPVVAEDLASSGQNLRGDHSAEGSDGVTVSKEGGDIWMSKQNVGGTFAAGAGNETARQSEKAQEVGDERRGIGNVGFARRRVMGSRILTRHIDQMEHVACHCVDGHRAWGRGC